MSNPRQRANWELALRRARCPKDGGHVLETAQPDVVCQKCGTQFTLAIQVGTFTMRQQLIEKSQPQPVYVSAPPQAVPQMAAHGRFCHNCGSPINEGARFCAGCGTQL